MLLVLTGAMIGFNWILLFEAYNYTTVAVATLCYYMQPVIVLLVSPLLFKEPVTLRKFLCVAAALAGMVLVSGAAGSSGAGTDPVKGMLLGLGAAALYASVVMLNKKITGVPVYEKTIIQLFSAAAALVPYMLARGAARSDRRPFQLYRSGDGCTALRPLPPRTHDAGRDCGRRPDPRRADAGMNLSFEPCLPTQCICILWKCK